MIKKIIAFAIVLAAFFGSAKMADAATRVGGYYKKNGTYVNSYHRSNSNSVKYDNYSSKGNYNPYTGKKGTKSW